MTVGAPTLSCVSLEFVSACERAGSHPRILCLARTVAALRNQWQSLTISGSLGAPCWAHTVAALWVLLEHDFIKALTHAGVAHALGCSGRARPVGLHEATRKIRDQSHTSTQRGRSSSTLIGHHSNGLMPPTSMAVRPPTTRPWPLQFGKSLLPHSAHIPSDTAGAGSSSFAGTPSWQRTARLRRTEAMRSGPFTWNEAAGCASALASAIEKPACCRRAKLVPSTSATLASRAKVDRDILTISPSARYCSVLLSVPVISPLRSLLTGARRPRALLRRRLLTTTKTFFFVFFSKRIQCNSSAVTVILDLSLSGLVVGPYEN